VPRSKKRGAIPPLLHKPSWRGAQLKHRDNFTFTTTTTTTETSEASSNMVQQYIPEERTLQENKHSFVWSRAECPWVIYSAVVFRDMWHRCVRNIAMQSQTVQELSYYDL
jgi:hypothetical protein